MIYNNVMNAIFICCQSDRCLAIKTPVSVAYFGSIAINQLTPKLFIKQKIACPLRGQALLYYANFAANIEKISM